MTLTGDLPEIGGLLVPGDRFDVHFTVLPPVEAQAEASTWSFRRDGRTWMWVIRADPLSVSVGDRVDVLMTSHAPRETHTLLTGAEVGRVEGTHVLLGLPDSASVEGLALGQADRSAWRAVRRPTAVRRDPGVGTSSGRRRDLMSSLRSIRDSHTIAI